MMQDAALLREVLEIHAQLDATRRKALEAFALELVNEQRAAH